VPSEPNLAHDVVVELEDGILERGRGTRPFEVEEHASRIVQAFVSIA
jgi:hypothetical protein